MEKITVLLILTLLINYNSRAENNKLDQNDSIKIANSSLTFYDWYLDCLNIDSTYNVVQPLYHWEDSIPVLDVSEYLDRLKNLGVVSNDFIESEIERFRICQDSLNVIDYKEVIKCGCSVGEFYQACAFLDYFYWINTQEKYNGCKIKEIKKVNQMATCQLLFYYSAERSDVKYFDQNFICILHLKKANDRWLIDKIDKYIK